MIKETDLKLADGRTLHCYDSGEAGARLTVFWHHGSPNTGTPPEPLFPVYVAGRCLKVRLPADEPASPPRCAAGAAG